MEEIYSILSYFCFLITCVGIHSRPHSVNRNGDIKLVGGRTPNEGTVLIYYRVTFGAICDHSWDVRDADVVCKQLGYELAERASYRSEFGHGRNVKLMSSLRCTGFEDKLKFCPHMGWGRMRRSCHGKYRSAGVVCKPKPTTTVKTTTIPTTTTTVPIPITTDKNYNKRWRKYLRERDSNKESRELPQRDAPVATEGLQIRMAGGRYDWEGRLEVNENHAEWGVICGDHWSIKETMVACRELGFEYGKQALQVNYFGGEDLNKHYHKIECKGKENSLDECEKIETDTSVTCSKPELVAGVVCTNLGLPDLIPDLEALEESVRLIDRPLYYLRCALEENCLAEEAHVIRNTTKNWHAHNRRLLRFSTVVHNVGLEDFRPYRAKSQWEWHECHMHYHSMEVFSHYDIVDEHGNRMAEGMKASFCLEDSTCQEGIVPKYDCTGFRDQGLSVNCSDNYMYDIDCQWIDITGMKPGEYRFKLEVNPTLLVAEMDFDNNVAACDFWYSGYNARIHNCVYESLLSG